MNTFFIFFFTREMCYFSTLNQRRKDRVFFMPVMYIPGLGIWENSNSSQDQGEIYAAWNGERCKGAGRYFWY